MLRIVEGLRMLLVAGFVEFNVVTRNAVLWKS